MTNKNQTNIYQKAIITSIIMFGFISPCFASPITEANIYNLINTEREKNQRQDLNVSEELNNAAYFKAKEIFNQNAFEHYLPKGQTPWDFIKGSGYKYSVAGENLAINFKNAEDTHKAWMNSPAHAQNILSERYEDVGIAVLDGKLNGKQTTLVVEMFGKPSNSFSITSTLVSIKLKFGGFMEKFRGQVQMTGDREQKE